MLRSVLVAAFSAAMAITAMGGLSGAKGDVRADSTWGVVAPDGPRGSVGDASASPAGVDDSTWG
ncbi:hypothetical protein C1I97_34055 [Streptomyces sp. NTH33]|nr:hypothetical protein C1I97_34055 [Streptomyces sp. NTH33]